MVFSIDLSFVREDLTFLFFLDTLAFDRAIALPSLLLMESVLSSTLAAIIPTLLFRVWRSLSRVVWRSCIVRWTFTQRLQSNLCFLDEIYSSSRNYWWSLLILKAKGEVKICMQLFTQFMFRDLRFDVRSIGMVETGCLAISYYRKAVSELGNLFRGYRRKTMSHNCPPQWRGENRAETTCLCGRKLEQRAARSERDGSAAVF